jgi:hypothetical protein
MLQSRILEELSNPLPPLPAEDEKPDSLGEKLALLRAETATLKEELRMVKLNKLGSSAFEFIPNRGMNRAQARQFSRWRKKHGNTRPASN